ncbi:hypothetical protein B0I33_107329 [Prauserella shujinwangii]|uniref:Uncharacterized protein n=1 Tax=Prauserella shujinwangii TaxID=1453103 RepID=A0A2T0LSV4_9PSEU|nr:hypothetical protein B0I33_107329 [Prauserella shujinwangii]
MRECGLLRQAQSRLVIASLRLREKGTQTLYLFVRELRNTRESLTNEVGYPLSFVLSSNSVYLTLGLTLTDSDS